MSSAYHSTFTIDLNEDQPHDHLIFYSKTEDASSSSSLSYPNFVSPNSHLQEPSAYYYHTESQPLPHQEQGLHQGSWDGGDHQRAVNENGNNGRNLSGIRTKEDDDQRQKSCVKWMSSKMRLMRKMMRSDDDQTAGNNNRAEISMHKSEDAKGRLYLAALQEDNNNTSNSIRVCTDCNTTKTPLWRSGPGGPKSLCNACGIRQRKARRALAAAQANANGAILSADTVPMKSSNKAKNKDKEKKTNNNNNSHLPFKKRCKFTSQSRANRKNKLCFEDLSSTILSKNSAFQQLFPQDEKEAAILLMALSYGLVHG